MPGLVEALRPHLPKDFVLGLKPLALETPERLRGVSRPVLLVTVDLDDPLPAWRKTKKGRKLGDRVSGWRGLSELAAHPEVREALDPRRTNLPTELALASPRLGPALEVLLPALGKVRQNEMNWTVRGGGLLLATLYAHNEVLSEGLRLRLTFDGLERWPSLKGPRPAGGKYPVTWLLDPEAAVDLAGSL